jgi:hypothetical protein
MMRDTFGNRFVKTCLALTELDASASINPGFHPGLCYSALSGLDMITIHRSQSFTLGFAITPFQGLQNIELSIWSDMYRYIKL